MTGRSKGSIKISHINNTNNNKPNFLIKCYKNISKLINIILFDTNIVGPICILIFLFEAILLELIIIKIPYTEIDYSTYMQQISQIENGELDYNKIKGDTGPIVYPGGYVFIYSWMKMITQGMNNLNKGQEVFKYLYLISFILTILIYIQSSGEKKIKPYQIYMLALSKRLHSIYVLRLFNDCFATFFVLCTIFLLQISAKFKSKYLISNNKYIKREMKIYSFLINLLAIDCYCFGISIKMNVLLYLPGFLIILYFLIDENLIKLIGLILFGILILIGINYQFLVNNNKIIRDNFIKNAFNFNRIFLFKWSVNWKFIKEEIFLNKIFHKILLILQIITLILFIINKWINKGKTGKSLKQLILIDGILNFFKDTISENNIIFNPLKNGFYISNLMMMSNLIGILYCRSLHYQFLSWYFYSLPLLFDNCGLPKLVIILMFIIHEWCWNKYPSSPLSSFCLVTILSVVVIGNYYCQEDNKDNISKDKIEENKKDL